jgi:capsular exopolysaccharide synthesis family protein
MPQTMTELSKAADRSEWRPMDEHLVSLIDSTSFEADQYRTLRHVLERTHAMKKVIAVTSAVAGDGKTTTTLNLAGVLGQAPDARILVVDLDLRTPTVGDRLGLITQSPGLVDMIFDAALTLDGVVRRHPQFRLAVLPAGRALTVPYEVLKSPRLGELLHEASQRYDYVILDTPPLVAVQDARLIADWVDGFVMVVAANRTPRKLLEDALNLMEPTKLIGLVFNGDDRRHSGYYGGYYGAYYGSANGGRHRAGRRTTGNGNGSGNGDARRTSVLDMALRAVLGSRWR